MTETVKQLLIINIIFFIGSQLVPAAYPLFSLYFPENESFRFWQPLTSMFMHAPMPNIMHIAFNMFALVSFGSALEHFWGPKKFLFFYISCGLGAALLHTLVGYFQVQQGIENLQAIGLQDQLNNFLKTGSLSFSVKPPNLDTESLSNMFSAYNTPSVGASGAIYGLLTAFAFMFPNAELALLFIPVPIKARYFVPGLIFLDLFLGFKGSSIFGSGGTGIAHFAHVGGAITGFIMMWYWKKNSFNNKRWD